MIEKLRPSAGLPAEEIAWFTVTPESWRERLVDQVAAATNWPSNHVPFVLTRLLLNVVFLIVSSMFAAWAVAPQSAQCDPDAMSQ